uniref:N-acetylglucosamine-6-phosphate deacetylase n=1 Tax=Vaginimicrobium propionicum TaxID=1871034 RepID=UPI001E40C471|nr:N-acetylglucosamine-6-phosphate deacetylase [Vaginimicrobium propionicum]
MVDFRCENLVVGDGRVLHDAGLTIVGDRVAFITEKPSLGAEPLDGWVVPGFVDTHCHGGGGAEFSDPNPQTVENAVNIHRLHGTTTLFASTVTAPINTLRDQLTRLRAFTEAGLIAGVHLEGPFLATEKSGAHHKESLINPSQEAIDALLNAGRDSIKMVTIAPELPGALDAIPRLTEAGIAVAFGHSNASSEQTHAGIAAGIRVATHLFNAMNAINHRAPGPIPALLTDSKVAIELICDGIHLEKDVIKMAVQTAGVERVILVTDAMAAAGAPEGDYSLGGLPVRVTNHTARLITPGQTLGAIAGSTLTMDRAFWFMVNALGFSIAQTSLMASTNPARTHHLPEVGELTPGKYADLCLLDNHAQLTAVMRHGQWLNSAGR